MLGNRPSRSQMYFGEDDELDFSEFETLCELTSQGSEESAKSSPVVPISPEKYHSLFQLWKGALLLKLLGKNVSFRILEQHTRSLWNLQHGCELINLEQGFIWLDSTQGRIISRFWKGVLGSSWVIILRSQNGNQTFTPPCTWYSLLWFGSDSHNYL